MKNLLLQRAVLLVALSLALGGMALADSTVDVNFPTAGDFYSTAVNGTGTIPSAGSTAPMWTAGDYVISSVFTGTGLASVDAITADWPVVDDLGDGSNETVYVYVNGIAVAQFGESDCGYCGTTINVTGTAGFTPIAPVAGGYQIELQLQNTIPGGGGSIWFNDGGVTGLTGPTSSPEPASMTLLGFGLVGLAGLARRKRIV